MSANELIGGDCQEDFLDDCPHTDTTPQVDVDAREAARVGTRPSYTLIKNGIEYKVGERP